MRKHNTAGRAVAITILAFFALICLFPIAWILFTSFKSESEIITGGLRLLPENFTLETYRMALFDKAFADQMPIMRWLFNSVLIAVIYTAIMLIISSLSAFAFARLDFKGKNFLFILLMSSLMIPQVVTLVPLYKIMLVFHWVGQYASMIFPGLASVFAVFLIRQFMMGIPRDYDEAAEIDGAGVLTIYSRIILPLVKPALVVSGLFVMLGNWNDFLWPSIVTNDIEMRTLPVGLQVLQSANQTAYGKLAVAAVISAIPIFLVYLVAQKYFVKGIALSGGIKG